MRFTTCANSVAATKGVFRVLWVGGGEIAKVLLNIVSAWIIILDVFVTIKMVYFSS